ncbi:MAG TPA: hypothetical protein VLL75_20675, partial [Vicinamibacteria bacterium]|nr:hypothetical protein [Vicinamibacteria bacterium]
ALIYGRTTVEAWRAPIAYRGDTLAVLAQLKVARLGYITPLRVEPIRELNAPFEGNWNDYPRPNKATFWVLGLVTRPFGLVVAANLLLLLAHLLAAASFHLVARHLRASRVWAAAGALVFSFFHFAFVRQLDLGHLMLGLYWHIPLCVLATAWSHRRAGLPLGASRFWWGGAIAIVSALQSVYYAFLFAQFLVLAAVGQALRKSGWRKVTGPLALAAAILALVATDTVNVALHRAEHGPNPSALQRSVQELETYALRPIGLLVPPPGRGLARGHSPWSGGSPGSSATENDSTYLGLAGAFALAWLSLRALRAVLEGESSFPSSTLRAVGWILLYSVVGGLNTALGLLGFVFLRASSRYSIWILTLVLLFLVGRLSRASLASRRGLGVLAALGLTALSLADQVPRFVSAPEIEAVTRQVASDRSFIGAVEASLPPGAMVFMMPVMDYPEVPPVRGVATYDHFRPFLHSSSLRFDYGSDKGRPRESWRHRVGRMSPPQVVAELERLGFAGIIVNRRGYEDGAARLLRGLAQAGRAAVTESATRGLSFVRLNPAHAPQRPGVPLLFGRGWCEEGAPESPEGTWSTGEAEWIVTNEAARPVALKVSFDLVAVAPRQVTIRRGATVLASWRVSRGLAVCGLRIPVPPGETRLTLSTDRPPDPPEDDGCARLVAFRVSNLELEMESGS